MKKAKQKGLKTPERRIQKAQSLQKQEKYGIINLVRVKKLKGECILF